MEKESAVQLVKNTFENSYREEVFFRFISDLLNEVDQNNQCSYGESGIPPLYRDSIKQYKRLAQYKDPAGDKLDVLAVNLRREPSPKRARTMQRNFIGWYLRSYYRYYDTNNALVAFYHEDVKDWRFSFVKRSYRSEQDESGIISPKEELTPPRRFSFLVGENEPSHT
ncbi:MAG: class I SAM-dependent DNA methyltransferase, partial [Rhodothermaceae bacterium]|nr:class I SAM-dependent DNA methyltransferase [Rhodothermaceae bacterium]